MRLRCAHDNQIAGGAFEGMGECAETGDKLPIEEVVKDQRRSVAVELSHVEIATEALMGST